MQGASALKRSLEAAPDADVDVVLVWEPVIASDKGPPKERTRRRVGDARVHAYWDEELLLSKEVIRTALAHRDELPAGIEINEGDVAWDLVMELGPGVRWEGEFPLPAWWHAPVIDGEVELTRRLRELSAPTTR